MICIFVSLLFVTALAQIIAPTADTKIYFNRNGDLLSVDGKPKSVRIQWQVTTKATDKVVISIGQNLAITVVDLAYLSPNEEANQITNSGDFMATKIVGYPYGFGGPSTYNETSWKLLSQINLVLRVRVNCGILSGCVVDKTNDIPIQLIPIDGCVWIGACNQLGNETAVSCTPHVADKTKPQCTCNTGYTHSGEKCVPDGTGTTATSEPTAATGSTTTTSPTTAATTTPKSSTTSRLTLNTFALVVLSVFAAIAK